MPENEIKETKNVNLSQLMYEAINLIPYLNSHKKLHRNYREPMINIIKAALFSANTKLLELNAYNENTKVNESIILNEVKKEEPKNS